MRNRTLLWVTLSLLATAGACGGGDDDPAIDGGPDMPDGSGPGPDGSGPGPDGSGPTADAGPGAFMFSGTVVGPAIPANAMAVVLWNVTTGTDYLYKYGQGPSTGASFMITLAGSPPPPEALNTIGGGSVGVGHLALVAAGTPIPDGVVNESTVTLIGLSPRHAVIWRNQDGGTLIDWAAAFPTDTYACGECVDSSTGFDSYTPVDCSVTSIDTSDPATLDFCNWT